MQFWSRYKDGHPSLTFQTWSDHAEDEESPEPRNQRLFLQNVSSRFRKLNRILNSVFLILTMGQFLIMGITGLVLMFWLVFWVWGKQQRNTSWRYSGFDIWSLYAYGASR
jgi:hypothetical protein